MKNKKEKQELKRITRLPIPEKIKLMEQKKYQDLFLNNDGNVPLKSMLIRKGMFINRLKNVKELFLKQLLVNHGYYMDKFKDDSDSNIRRLIAKKGKYLNEFKNDKDWRIRAIAASFGVYSKKYINNRTLCIELINYYLKQNYRKNVEICEKCNRCEHLFCSRCYRYGDSSYYNSAKFNKKECPFYMEHSVLSNGFVNIDLKELLEKAIEFCDKKEENKC